MTLRTYEIIPGMVGLILFFVFKCSLDDHKPLSGEASCRPALGVENLPYLPAVGSLKPSKGFPSYKSQVALVTVTLLVISLITSTQILERDKQRGSSDNGSRLALTNGVKKSGVHV